MLLRFVLDADVLSSEDIRPAVLDQFLGHWSEFGALCIDGNTVNKSCLMNAIKKLPFGSRKNFEQMLQRVAIIPLENDWKGKIKSENEKSFSEEIIPLQKKVHVIVTNETKFHAGLGFPESDHWKNVGAEELLECCQIDFFGLDTESKKAKNLTGQPIGRNTSLKVLWDERFRTLAQSTVNKIIIVDGYVVINFLANRTSVDKQYNSGLANFLRLVHNEARYTKHITIYSRLSTTLECYKKGNVYETFSDDEIARMLKDDLSELVRKLKGKKLGSITIYLIPSSFNKTFADRYLRFDDYVWEIGHAMEVFATQRTRDYYPASFKGLTYDNTYREIESSLESKTKKRVIKDQSTRITIYF